jgi:aromatic-L-amino-acid/L-tryptophan decarboxylase
MDPETFRRHGHDVIDRIADYMQNVEGYPVLSRVKPGEIRDQLPGEAPPQGESMESILEDFERIIMPGVTHWNHPRFFAYFPANHSGPAILGELLSAGLGVNGMVWQSCPAATELEEVVMEWVRRMLGLPEPFRGVIQDTASTASLCALLCARERSSGFEINRRGPAGWAGTGTLRVYVSTEAHSSIEKGAKIAGFGAENVVSIAVDERLALDAEALERKIVADRERGFKPCCVVATIGTTSSTAIDPLRRIGEIAARHGLWLHVDAALAGSAAILPEMRGLIDGVELCHSFVFNPHKWLFTNFDCSAFFCREPETLVRTLTILPEYLKTGFDDEVTNFRDWGIPLGRRFRALKLWFVLRWFGLEGLQERLRAHIALAREFFGWVEESADFEVLAPVPVQTVCFRYNPWKGGGGGDREGRIEELNRAILDAVNASGRIFITQTRLKDRYCLRLSVGQIATAREHVEQAWQALRDVAVQVRFEGRRKS